MHRSTPSVSRLAYLAVTACLASSCSESSGDAEVVRSPACDRFLECAAAVTPAGIADLIERYGEAGTCFEGSSSEIRLCNAACWDARAMLAQAFEHGVCYECSRDDHCEGVAAPLCDTTSNTCVHCTTNEHCDSEAPICDRRNGQCVVCLEDLDCEGAKWCDLPAGLCVECEPDSKVCLGDTPVHCSADGTELILDPCDVASTCKAGQCERKPYGPCSSGSDCQSGWVCAGAGDGRWCAPNPGGAACTSCPDHEFSSGYATQCLATHVCGVLCSPGGDCPSGMQCEPSDDLMVCTWPAT